MKSAFKSFQIFLLLCGVFGADGDEVKSVMEGESVTLDPDLTQIKKFNLMEWRFGDLVIAQIEGNDISYPSHTDIFRGRLQLDQTGSLTIKNMKTKHSGLYQLQISHRDGTSEQKFSVTVSESLAVIDAVEAEMKSFSLTEGDPVTLQTDVPQLHGDELIVWRFGDEGKLIAKADIESNSSTLYPGERFRDRLKLDQTGSLTITNTRTTDTGPYTVKISSRQTLYKKFTVTVSSPPGVSPGAVAGIVVGVLLVAAVAGGGVAAGVVVAGVRYHRRRISELRKRILLLSVIVTVMEGEDVTLKPNEVKNDDYVLWLFGGDKRMTGIAEIRTKPRKPFTYDVADRRFRGRLKLDETGSLTIRNTRTEHSGVYTIQTSSSGETSQQTFTVIVNARLVLITVGRSVHLSTGLTEIQRDEEIEWMFGDNFLVAGIKGGTGETHDGPDKRFRDRLQLNEKTGDLTILNSRAGDDGRYKVKIHNSKGDTHRVYTVVIRDEGMTPVMGKKVFSGKRENESDVEMQPLNK